MQEFKWIPNPETDIEEWINDFFSSFVQNEGENEAERLRHLYRAGYCWHFAHTLKTTFGREEVCWAAPFGHVCFVDEDGTPYDIEGKYTGEAYYMIPEKYLGDAHLDDFRHIKGKSYGAGKQELISIIKRYCIETGEKYYPDIEKMFN